MRKHTTEAQKSDHTILVIDDQPEILTIDTALLQDAGHTVVTASSGEAALALFQPGQFQLILVDYFMPRMTGEEVIREIRKVDEDVQIVLQTGYAGEKPPLQMLDELDIQGYHDKIDSPDRLLMLVKSALKAAVHLQQVRQAEQLKSELLANVTHELRTPLSVLLGYSKLLLANEARPLPDDIHDGLERMHRQARRLSALVENFLNMAQVQAAEMKVVYRETRLADFQDEMCELMDFLLDKKAVAFDWRVSSDLPSVWADPHQLVIILRNLLANAAKFTEAGTISVWATANEADQTVVLHVQDTGIGITPAEHAHVFERFRQVDGSLSRKYQGTGIGLALSRQLAELMEGTLQVESQLGAGATFTLTLKRVALAGPTLLERQSLSSSLPLHKGYRETGDINMDRV